MKNQLSIKCLVFYIAIFHFEGQCNAAASVVNPLENPPPCAMEIPRNFQSYRILEKEKSAVYSMEEIATSQFSKMSMNLVRLVANPDFKSQDDKLALENYINRNFKYNSFAEISMRNAGIVKSNQILLSNSCFAEKAKSFYAKVSKINSSARERPWLGEVAGKGNFSNLKPGWLWKLALEETHGDKNLALSLIGLCGHDDKHQSNLSSVAPSSLVYTITLTESEKGEFKTSLVNCQADLLNLKKNGDTDSPEYKKLDKYINHIFNVIGDRYDLTGAINCPNWTSPMYAAGSLGENVDLQPEIKEQIQKYQENDLMFGNKRLPSKYYHIMGGAQQACTLIQDGMTPKNALMVQSMASAAYRATRLCMTLSADEKFFSEWSNDLENLTIEKLKEIKDPKLIERFRNVGFNLNVLNSLPNRDLELKLEALKSYIIASQSLHHWNPNKNELSSAKGEYSKQFGEQGEKLFDQISSGKGFDFQYSALKAAAGLKDQNSPEKDCILNLVLMQFSPSYKQALKCDLKTPRCAAAGAKLDSWNADMTWTTQSHRKGAEFAAKACSKLSGSFQSLASNKCQNINKSEPTVYKAQIQEYVK